MSGVPFRPEERLPHMSTVLRSVDPESILLRRFGGLSRRLAALPSFHVGAVALAALLGGLLLSIATTSDPLWWQLHFSQLGIFNDFSSALFNTTLKVSGSLVILFALFVRRDIVRLGRGPVRRGSATLACICLNVVGINLALVGCVPLNTDKDLHDRVAGMMVLGFLALLVSAPFMMGRLGRRMAVSTAVALIWLVLSITLFVTATINLALFETISCSAMFAWSGMLTHTIGRPATPTEKSADAVDTVAGRESRRARVRFAGRRARLVVRAPRPSDRSRVRSTAPAGSPRRLAGEDRAVGVRRAAEDHRAAAEHRPTADRRRNAAHRAAAEHRAVGARENTPRRAVGARENPLLRVVDPPRAPRRRTEPVPSAGAITDGVTRPRHIARHGAAALGTAARMRFSSSTAPIRFARVRPRSWRRAATRTGSPGVSAGRGARGESAGDPRRAPDPRMRPSGRPDVRVDARPLPR